MIVIDWSHIVPARECMLAPSIILLPRISALFPVLCLMYFLSHLFFVSSFVSNAILYLICFMSLLILSLKPQAAQAVSQYSDRVLNHVLTSSLVSQSVIRNKD